MKKALKPEMKLGADPRRIALLGGLLGVLAIVWFINRTPDQAATPSAAPSAPATAAPGIRQPVRPLNRPNTARRAPAGARGLSAQEFHPTLKPADNIDMAKVDPTLRLDVLAKLKNVRTEGGSRSLFEFSGASPAAAAPIPKVAKIIPKPMQLALATGPEREKPPAPPPAPPPPPPIPLKFYGYTGLQKTSAAKRQAFFIEGEDIFVAAEGDVIKNRYKIVRIGTTSAVVEDTQFKSQQTLPLIEEVASS